MRKRGVIPIRPSGRDVQKPPTLADPNHVAAGLHNAVVLLRALDRGAKHDSFSRSAAAFWPRLQNTEIDVYGRLPRCGTVCPVTPGPGFIRECGSRSWELTPCGR